MTPKGWYLVLWLGLAAASPALIGLGIVTGVAALRWLGWWRG